MATQAELAVHLDLADRHVRRLLREGVLPGSKGAGGLNLDACRVAYIRYLRGLVSGQVRTNRDGPEDIALDLARARNLQADTRLKELREARERREVAPVALMQWTLAHAGAQIAALLETIPGQVKRALPSLGAAELEIIKRAVVSAQNTAAALALDFDDYDAADPAPALGPASGPAPGARQPGAP